MNEAQQSINTIIEALKQLAQSFGKAPSEPEIWKPEKGEGYFIVHGYGQVYEVTDYPAYSPYSKNLNCFKTREEAEEYSKYSLALLKFLAVHRAIEGKQGKGSQRWRISVLDEPTVFDDLMSAVYKNVLPSFSSRGNAELAIKMMGNDIHDLLREW